LRRIEENGWASGEWGLSENNRKVRYYTITKAGQKQLAREKENWKSIIAAVEKVLEGA
jgi:DNA-binding PadR family transcriptional regulator